MVTNRYSVLVTQDTFAVECVNPLLVIIVLVITRASPLYHCIFPVLDGWVVKIHSRCIEPKLVTLLDAVIELCHTQQRLDRDITPIRRTTTKGVCLNQPHLLICPGRHQSCSTASCTTTQHQQIIIVAWSSYHVVVLLNS